jgi:sarcosine oxidase / L-pipecolate oxidase
VPQIKGPCSGWSGYFNKHAGYARAGLALKKVHHELVRRGVAFEFGARGEAEEILQSADSKSPRIRTKSGAIHTGDFTIIALGAHTPKLLPSAATQLTAKAWAVGHVQLSPDEAADLKGMPVINCRDLGFLFEPDLDTGLIKLCANGGGYTNYIETGQRGGDKRPGSVSVPPSTEESHAGIPLEDEKLLRKLLAETLPQFKDRPLVKQFVCWCSDTRDSEYIIDYVPGWNNLILAGGDSGHAFKMFPIFGKWVVEVLEGGKQPIDRWKWKDIDANELADDIGWRVGSVKDIKLVCWNRPSI